MVVARSEGIGSDFFINKEKITKINNILTERASDEIIQESLRKLESFAQNQAVQRETTKKQSREFRKTIKRRIRKFGKSAKERRRLYRRQKNLPRP